MTLLTGALKFSPVAGLLAAVSVKDLALYVSITTALSGILVVGAIWSAAKAWRERAEARTDEASDLRAEMKDRDSEIARLGGIVDELRTRPDLTAGIAQMQVEHADLRERDAEEHRAIITSVDRLSGQLAGALDRNTVALEALARNVPWAEIINHGGRR